MVQECNVLRCCLCQIYQVQQVTKQNKCKLRLASCVGEKQSVIKEFGRSSGVDCRRHVQKLNASFLGKTFERFTITHCGFGEAAKWRSRHMSLPEIKAPVCHQPPHTK
ncbi:MRN complex-interacting protein-like [Oncorhynchus masou masou]|uniref:MRN complex-interacting protein-like n=1 Tax=Oncorhynchus masou masou TaxID=90313 RepID=UPI0031839CE4